MRVAAYIRVSTEEQAIHGLSLDAQQEALTEWVKANGHELVDIYADPGISARKPASKRPDLQRLLRDVEAGKVDLIIFTKLDRWFRSIADYYKVQEVLEKHHVPWKAIWEDYETQTSSGRLKTNIMLSVSQDESDRTGDRIKAVFAAKKLRGEVCSGNAPVGLKYEDKRFVPSDDAWKVQEMFDVFLSTRSVEQTVLRSHVGLKRVGTKYALSNRHYVEAGVISPEDFDKVQQILQVRSQRTVLSRVYLFSGLMTTQGRKMDAHPKKAKGREFISYRSPWGIKPSYYVSEDKIEQFLLDNIVAQLDAMAALSEKKEKPVDPAAIRRKMDRLTDLLLKDLITPEKYETEYRSLQAQLRPAPKQHMDRKEILSALAIYDRLDRESKKAFWSRCVQRIDFSPSREITFFLFP